ncbi:MAG TPA: hypothetical protein VFI76_08370, partial [Terrimicrobiaceae bacterium]|nr:hypothetical protein [Terrimicrobiaceae bacterium]
QILALISYYVGFATTMAEATRLPAAAWAGAIFLVCFYFLMRGSFASAIGFVFLIGGLNVATVVVLLIMTIPHIQTDHLAFSAWTSASAFDPSWLQLVFGVIFSAYLGHLGVANSAQFALRRDSSARALIRGSVAAQITLIVIYSLWVVAVNGALNPHVLAEESGTALVPLASHLGPVTYVLGSSLIFLGIGVGSIVTALGLFCLVKEWLPSSRISSTQDVSSPLRRALSDRGFWFSASPVVIVFGYVEWLLVTGTHSFTSPLSFLGVLAAPLIAGVFPLLLLVASRAKGDRPMRWCPTWLSHPVVIGGIYAIFTANLFVHGLFIWQGPVERLAALAVGIGVLAIPIILIRQGAFASRTVVELRREAFPECEGSLTIVTSGRRTDARVRMEYARHWTFWSPAAGPIADFSSLRRVQLRLFGQMKELKVWVHRETADGDSEGIPVRLKVVSAGHRRAIELRSLTGKAIVPIVGGPVDLEMELLDSGSEDTRGADATAVAGRLGRAACCLNEKRHRGLK